MKKQAENKKLDNLDKKLNISNVSESSLFDSFKKLSELFEMDKNNAHRFVRKNSH